MSTIVLSDFNGILPRYGSQSLPDNCATTARNVKLESGEIRAWRKPVAEYQCMQQGVRKIFKMDAAGGATTWCEWTKDTDVCYGPLADNNEFRIYYSEGGVCKKTNYDLCTDGNGPAPRNWYYMGVPYPEGELNAKANRVPNDPDQWAKDHPNDPYEEYSADNTENRAYVYTYVAEFGSITEESAPSDPVEVTCDISGGSVSLSGFVDPPTDHVNITKVRIYRSVTGQTTATYLFVDEIDLVNHKFPESGVSLNTVSFENRTYNDARTAAQLGKDLDSLYFYPPPENLKGLVSMPNGFLAGFVSNQVWFSEPYLPHAWPPTYMLTTDSPIVGLGVYGNTLVVMTTRQPYTISGTHPGSMTQEMQPMMQPCMSKQSIAYDQYGVMYASSYGLVVIAGGQMDVFTRPLVTQDDWLEKLPSTMNAVMYNNKYVLSYRQGTKSNIYIFSRGDQPVLTEYAFTPVTMHVERGTGNLYALKEEDNKIYWLDGDNLNKEPFEWTSKVFANPYATSFSAMKLDASYRNDIDYEGYALQRTEAITFNKWAWDSWDNKQSNAENNGAQMNWYQVNGSEMKPVPDELDVVYVSVTIYADGKAIYTRLFNNVQSVRIPPVKAYKWQVQIVGTIDVRAFAMATSMRELASPK